jgi:hypothetical protein
VKDRRIVKKSLLGLLMLILIMQLLQPTRNISEGPYPNDISHVYAIPGDIKRVIQQKCYDCHSNNTHYPWYIHIQPIGWWMASHIKEAKDDLNFSEFKTYSEKEAAHKFEEIGEVVEDGTMPIKSYVWLHQDAALTDAEKSAILNWVEVAESTRIK